MLFRFPISNIPYVAKSPISNIPYVVQVPYFQYTICCFTIIMEMTHDKVQTVSFTGHQSTAAL